MHNILCLLVDRTGTAPVSWKFQPRFLHTYSAFILRPRLSTDEPTGEYAAKYETRAAAETHAPFPILSLMPADGR